MRAKRMSRSASGAARGVKFSNGMFVRYAGGHARHSGLVAGGTYTVAHSAEDGAQAWVYLQEVPGLRLPADAFEPVPHQAEDHWQMAEPEVWAAAGA